MPTGHDCSQHYELQTDEKLFTCDGCKMKGLGPRHICKLCDKVLHKVCWDPEPSITGHEFLGCAGFTFTQLPSTVQLHDQLMYANRCTACRMDIRGFSYYCESQNIYIHPSCWRLERMQDIEGMVYDLTAQPAFACSWCDDMNVPLQEGWSYVSSCGRYHYHVYCMMEMVFNDKLMKKHQGVQSIQRVQSRPFTLVNKLAASAWDLIKSFFRVVVQKFKEFGEWCFERVREVAIECSIEITESFYDRVIGRFLRVRGRRLSNEEALGRSTSLYYSYNPFFGSMT